MRNSILTVICLLIGICFCFYTGHLFIALGLSAWLMAEVLFFFGMNGPPW